MRRIRRWCFILALFVLFLSFLVDPVVNFVTISDPTGRRYSSGSPVREGSLTDIGRDAERILSRDLGLLLNQSPNPVQCICNPGDQNAPPRVCNACFAISSSISHGGSRQPDFVSATFLADAKNVGQLRDFEQIQDFAVASLQLEIPLWIYTRVDTVVSQRFYDLVEPTGGGIVPYFTYVGYQDPIDEVINVTKSGSLIILIIMGISEVSAWWLTPRPTPVKPPQPNPSDHRKNKTEEIFASVQDLKDRARRRVDAASSFDDE